MSRTQPFQSRKRKAEDDICSKLDKFQRTVSKEAFNAALKINTERRKKYVKVLDRMIQEKRQHMETIKELQAKLDEQKEAYKSTTQRIFEFKLCFGVPVDALQISEDDDSELHQLEDEEAA